MPLSCRQAAGGGDLCLLLSPADMQRIYAPVLDALAALVCSKLAKLVAKGRRCDRAKLLLLGGLGTSRAAVHHLLPGPVYKHHGIQEVLVSQDRESAVVRGELLTVSAALSRPR